MDEARGSWEQRAQESGTDFSGVLFRGLSDSANHALHEWHSWLVGDVLAPRIPSLGTVLDLGCGFGRLSAVLQKRSPGLRLVGQDMAMTYCRHFHRALGACVCADARALPFVSECFDGAMVVTCLMYGGRSGTTETLRDLRRVLRSDGIALFVDPGIEMQRLIACIRRNRTVSPTGGAGFARKEYQALIRDAGFSIVAVGGNPLLSALLMVPGIGGSMRKNSARLLQRAAGFDCKLAGYSLTALHRWVLARKA